MICLGIYKFLISIYGFAISNTESRGMLALFGVLLAIAFIGQLASIFVAIEVRTTIVLAEYGGTNVIEALRNYGLDPIITQEWDTMQQEQRCCGGTNFLTGYSDYRNTPIGGNFSVPDSCCHQVSEGCGRDIFRIPPEQLRNKIWVTGCLTALRYRLNNVVAPMMETYAGVSVLIAIVQLIAVVLTCAYIAQITRRRTREEMMWKAVHDNEEDNHHADAARALNPHHETETVC